MRPLRTAYKVDINEQLAYGPALVKQAVQSRVGRLMNGPPHQAEGVIISLTSFPERLPKLHNCIHSLLNQSVRAEKIILYLTHEECNEDSIPSHLRRLQSKGLEIRFVDKNARSLNKICHALTDFPDKTIITCDDDKLYPLNMLERLISTAKAYPHCIVCNRSRRIVFDADGKPIPYKEWPACELVGPSSEILPMGVGGILYPAGSLHPNVLDIDLYMRLSATSDDLWLKIMSLRQGTQCVQVNPKRSAYPSIPFWQGQKLSPANIWKGGNDQNLASLLAHFDIDLAKQIRDNER